MSLSFAHGLHGVERLARGEARLDVEVVEGAGLLAETPAPTSRRARRLSR
jgi:hypothetical protein